MLATGWSWSQYCELPEPYVDVLIQVLSEQAQAVVAERQQRRRRT